MTQQPMKKPRLGPEAVPAAAPKQCEACANLRARIAALEAMIDERDRAIRALQRQ